MKKTAWGDMRKFAVGFLPGISAVIGFVTLQPIPAFAAALWEVTETNAPKAKQICIPDLAAGLREVFELSRTFNGCAEHSSLISSSERLVEYSCSYKYPASFELPEAKSITTIRFEKSYSTEFAKSAEIKVVMGETEKISAFKWLSADCEPLGPTSPQTGK